MKFSLELKGDRASVDDCATALRQVAQKLEGRWWSGESRDGVVDDGGVQGGWELEDAFPCEGEIRAAARKLDRAQLVDLLTAASIQCRDEDTMEELQEALVVNVSDGTIEYDEVGEP